MSTPTFALDPNSFWGRQTTKIGGGMVNYSGSETRSLGGEKGYGGEITTERGFRTFSLFGKVRGEYANGRATFSDGGTDTDLSYQLWMGEVHIGAKLGLFPSKRFLPYLSVAGVLGVSNLSFPSATSLSRLKKSEDSLTFGYEVSAGAEWDIMKDPAGGRVLLFGEVQIHYAQAQLAGRNQFDISGLRVVGGFGW